MSRSGFYYLGISFTSRDLLDLHFDVDQEVSWMTSMSTCASTLLHVAYLWAFGTIGSCGLVDGVVCLLQYSIESIVNPTYENASQY